MLDNILKAKNKPHAILLVETKASDVNEFINNYMKSILPPTVSSKIDNLNYHDILTIDGYSETIKKEQIANIVRTFSSSSLEKEGIKFYIIHGVENATHSAINSLLKFLEEPTNDTYAILTTRALQKVLGTIKSRCQVYRLASNLNDFTNHLNKLEISPELKNIISKIYYSWSDAEKDIKSKRLLKQYEFCVNFINGVNDLSLIKESLTTFKKFDYQQIEIILKILNVMKPNSETLFKLIDDVKYNPTKTLLFNRIWENIKN